MSKFKKVNLIITPLFSLPVNNWSEEKSGMLSRVHIARDTSKFGRVEGKEERSHSVLSVGTRFIASAPSPTRMLAVLESVTLRLPAVESKPISRKAGRGAILWASIIAAAVLAVYLVIPLVFTLIPLLPTNGSRVLIALQLLLLAELVVYCILRRTTSTRGRSKADSSAR